MDLRDKILHYAIDFTGETPTDSVKALVDSGFDQCWLEEYDPQRNRMTPSVHSTLYALAYAHFAEHNGLITPQTLGHQFKHVMGELAAELRMDVSELKAQAQTAVLGAQNTPSNLSEIHYVVDQVRNSWMRNAVVMSLTRAARGVDDFSPTTVAQTIIGELEQLQQRVGGSNTVAVTVRDMVPQRLDEYDHRDANPDQYRGLLTGFTEMDKLTNGLQPGEIVTVVGNTGIGKTKFREKMLYNFWRGGHSVVEVLSECYPEHTQERLECMALGGMISVPPGMYLSHLLRAGKLTEEQKEVYRQVLESFEEIPSEYCIVSPNSYMYLDELESTIAGLKQRHGIMALGVDDFHNQRLGSLRDAEDHLTQGAVMTWLKRIAVRYKLVVLVEIQEKQGTVGKKHVDKSEVVAYSHKIAEKSDMIIRLYDDGGDANDGSPSIYKLVQVLKHKTSADHYSFPIVMDDRRMFIDNAPAHAVAEVFESPLLAETVKSILTKTG